MWQCSIGWTVYAMTAHSAGEVGMELMVRILTTEDERVVDLTTAEVDGIVKQHLEKVYLKPGETIIMLTYEDVAL